jgi:hypothetical protein
MIFQNNPTPWVVLVIISIALVLVCGSIIGNSELLNPTRASQEAYVRATMGSINAEATQQFVQPTYNAIHATQVMQNQIAAATLVPMQMTATQQAAIIKVAEMSNAATQNAIVLEVQKQVQSAAVQQTQIAKQMVQVDTENTLSMIEEVGIIGIVLVMSFALVYWMITNGRARERNAQARYLAEQRRNVELSLAIRDKVHKTDVRKSPTPFSSRTYQQQKGSDQEHDPFPLAK